MTLYQSEKKRPRISIHHKSAIIYYYYEIKWYIEGVKKLVGNINSDHIIGIHKHTCVCITNLFAYLRQFPYKILYFATE